MKEQNYKNIDEFQYGVKNLKIENRFFFADSVTQTIYTNEENESFLDFYLRILVCVTIHANNELQSLNSTKWYFYLPKSFAEYSKKDLQIMLDKLGNNLDDWDGQFTDKIGVIY